MRRSVILLSALLGLGALQASAYADERAESLGAASAALEDGFYDLAQKQLERILKETGSGSRDRVQVLVLLAQAYWGQGNFENMLKLTEDGLGKSRTSENGALVYWHAVAQYELGHHDRALSELDGFATRFPDDACGPKAARLVAWCQLKAGRTAEALSAFAAFDKQYGASTAEGLANLLDWGQALLVSGDTGSARQIFEKLAARAPESQESQEGRLWLAKTLIGEGRWEAAWNLLNLAANDTGMRIDRRSRACLALSEVNAAQTNIEAAVAAAAKGVELAPTQLLRNRGKALQGRWLIRQGKLDSGAALLRAVIAAAPEDTLSGALQLELAGAYLEQGQCERAAEEYQYYLETFTDTSGQVRALRGRGLALWTLKRYAEAAAVYEKAAALVKDPGEKEQCLVKAADALFANGQHKLAADAYERVLVEFPGTALAAQLTFQLAESLGRQGEGTRSEETFRALVRRFPDHPLAERALMRIAEMKEERGAASMREALAAYQEVMDAYPGGALYAEALFRHGAVAYQLLQFEEALKDFSRTVSEFPTNRVAPQAFFMRGRSLYMMGQEEEALAVGRAFIERYPDTEWTPRVVFWLGEYAFNRGAYAEAETQFQSLVAKFPKDALADQSLLWAGRAAMKQKEYLRAVDVFARLAESYPASPRMAEARFLQGDALCELGEFSRAIVVFDDLIARYPNSPLVSAAWGRKGDCQFTLGASDVKRYSEAVLSYRAVAKSPGVTFDLDLQAEYKIGRCLEKLGSRNEAFEQYYTRVVARYLEQAKTMPRDVSVAAAAWFTKAVFAVADILEADKNWRRAVKILERLIEEGVPAGRDAQERIDRIRSEHWIW